MKENSKTTMMIAVVISLMVILGGAEANCSRGYENDNSESLANGANDVIVVKQSDGSFKATPIQVQVRV